MLTTSIKFSRTLTRRHRFLPSQAALTAHRPPTADNDSDDDNDDSLAAQAESRKQVLDPPNLFSENVWQLQVVDLPSACSFMLEFDPDLVQRLRRRCCVVSSLGGGRNEEGHARIKDEALALEIVLESVERREPGARWAQETDVV